MFLIIFIFILYIYYIYYYYSGAKILREFKTLNYTELWNEPIHGRITYQPDLTTFLQPRHIPTQGYNTTQSSAPDDGHMVARNILSNY
jgi:hypothetical protein